jgi:8-oxo-dGTP pyrophosphatase MutT (NUDIX family)
VVARAGGRVLVVFNRWRGEWELPGGDIEPGESARDAAERELREETGQTAGRLTFSGTARLRPAGAVGEEACALFVTTIPEQRPFSPSDEIGAIAWWDGSVDPPGGPLNPIDRALIGLTVA